MFCKNCGKQIPDGAHVCPYCGRSTGTPPPSTKIKGTNTLAIVGFVFSFLFALVGLICSIIGFNRSNDYENGGNRGLALAGIIISAISMGLGIIIVISAM